MSPSRSNSSPAIEALSLLSIFSPYQAAAYREHSEKVTSTFGRDVATSLQSFLNQFSATTEPSAIFLTGNAGTGKTAALESFCRARNVALPEQDSLVQIAPNSFVLKDLSGVAERDRSKLVAKILDLSSENKIVACANEGVLRQSLRHLEANDASHLLDDALRSGAARNKTLLFVNVNRQRPTADPLWSNIVNYLTNPEIWNGCAECPYDEGGCSPRTNAAALRSRTVQAALQLLFRYSAAKTPATMREVLSLLAWAINGSPSQDAGSTCDQIKRQYGDRGPNAATATSAYYQLLFGDSLSIETIERSPLLMSVRQSSLGDVSDLQVDEWLRDVTSAPIEILHIAAADSNQLSPLAQTLTSVGALTFKSFGETLSTSEDPLRVAACIDALIDDHTSVLKQWRRRAYFEGHGALGGLGKASGRLTRLRFFGEMLAISKQCSVTSVRDSSDLLTIVRGLNVLIAGFNNTSEGLVIPESATLFARDPGTYVPPEATLIHSYINLRQLSLRSPDRGLVRQILDVDDIEFELVVNDDQLLTLTITPDLYEAIREAEEFSGPTGQGVAFMIELREFYGRLASRNTPNEQIRIAAGTRLSPALIAIRLPSV